MTTCKTCNGKGTIEYYHDAGDHFGAGISPWSEWRDKPCPECEKRKEEEEFKASIHAAVMNCRGGVK